MTSRKATLASSICPTESPGVEQQVATLIPNRAMVQLGVGILPAVVAKALAGYRDFGVHSGVVSDVLVDLVDQGVATNEFMDSGGQLQHGHRP